MPFVKPPPPPPPPRCLNTDSQRIISNFEPHDRCLQESKKGYQWSYTRHVIRKWAFGNGERLVANICKKGNHWRCLYSSLIILILYSAVTNKKKIWRNFYVIHSKECWNCKASSLQFHGWFSEDVKVFSRADSPSGATYIVTIVSVGLVAWMLNFWIAPPPPKKKKWSDLKKKFQNQNVFKVILSNFFGKPPSPCKGKIFRHQIWLNVCLDRDFFFFQFFFQFFKAHFTELTEASVSQISSS